VYTFSFIQNKETVNGSGLDTRSRWPCSLRQQSTAVWFLLSRFRIPLRARIFASCVCRGGSGICYQIIICSKESYRVCLCKLYKPQQLVRPRRKKTDLINSSQTLKPTPPSSKLSHDNRGYSVIISEVTPGYLNRGPVYCLLSEERKQLLRCW
jgi:hypothetical protein